MTELQSTRLRFIKAPSLEILMSAVESLPYKVEIKGSPVKDGDAWVVFFTIPESVLTHESVDFTRIS